MGCELESGEQHIKNIMTIDVGRWNLLKATLGTLELMGIILRTTQSATTESPVRNTDHQEIDPLC